MVTVFVRRSVSLFLGKAPVAILNTRFLVLRPSTLIISWFGGGDSSKYQNWDKFFGVIAREERADIFKIFICTSEELNKNSDVFLNIIFERNIRKNLKWVAQRIFELARHRCSLGCWLYSLDPDCKNSNLMASEISHALIRQKLTPKNLILPYEQQPWQSALILAVKKANPMTISHGYIHSQTSFPAQFFYNFAAPHRVWTHSSATKRVLIDYLGWSPASITEVNSFRFVKPMDIDLPTVFLPMSIEESDRLLKSMRVLVSSYPDLFQFGIRVAIHPLMQQAPEHIELKHQIEGLIFARPNTDSINHSLKPVVVALGISAVILEALESGYGVIVLEEDSIFGSFNSDIWPELQVEALNPEFGIFAFRLLKPKSMIAISESQNEHKLIGDFF